MPYKDLKKKLAWELRNRPQRLARRRELRRIEATREAVKPGGFPWIYMMAGVVLVSFSSVLALGVGSLILIVAGLRNKGWRWWIVGLFILMMSLFVLRNREDTTNCPKSTQPDFN
jgi:hypothetical protein